MAPRSATCCAALCATLWLGVGLCLVSPTAAFAQKAPQLGYAYPPAVRIGETTKIAFGGYDLTEDVQYFVHHADVELLSTGPLSEFFVPPPPYWFGEKGRLTAFPIPREVEAELRVGDAEPGLAQWQVANANGISGTAPIYLSRVPELLEQRWREQPQTLPTLATGERFGVSGRLLRIAEVDAYRLQTSAPTQINIDVLARRLGADFHPVVKIVDEKGRSVADVADTEGRDLQVSFNAAANQPYTLRLHDVDYRGNRAFVYRLDISAGLQAAACLPTRLTPGEKRRVRLLGAELDITAEAVAASTQKPLVIPTKQGDVTATLPTLAAFSHPEPVFTGSGEIREEMIGAEARSVAWDLTQLSPADVAECRWPLRLPAGQWRIQADSEGVHGCLDLALEVFDKQGKRVAQNDDWQGTSTAAATLQVDQEAEFEMVVRELSGKVGRFNSIGRLSVRPLGSKAGDSAGSSQPVAEKMQVTAPQRLAIPIGGKAAWKFTAERHGYLGPIHLQINGLPPGVTAPDKIVIPEKKNAASVALEAAEDAAAVATSLEVEYWMDGRPESRQTLRAPCDTLVAASASTLPKLLLATTLKPKYQVKLRDRNRQRAVHRGTTYPAPFVIEREDGFDGEVRLQMASKQGRHRQGIRGPILKVAADESEALYPCFMPEWLETDRTTRMVVLGVATQRDPQGTPRQVTQSADARITMILEGALLTISEFKPEGARLERTVMIGETCDVAFEIGRSQKLSLPVRVELQAPPELAPWCTAEAVDLTKDQVHGTLRLSISAAPKQSLARTWPLTIRAYAMQDGRWPVVSQMVTELRLIPRE